MSSSWNPTPVTRAEFEAVTQKVEAAADAIDGIVDRFRHGPRDIMPDDVTVIALAALAGRAAEFAAAIMARRRVNAILDRAHDRA